MCMLSWPLWWPLRPWQPPDSLNGLRYQFWPWIWNKQPLLPWEPCACCLDHFGGLWGHGDLETASMASDVNFNLRFEISNLNYPGNYVYVVLNTLFGCLRGHEGLQMTSEVATDLKFEISGLNNPCSSASLASIVFYLTNLARRKAEYHPLTCRLCRK